MRATGRLDVLVNNAAVQYAHAGLAQVTPQELEDVFATNIYAYFHCAAAALPHLKAGGAIINTSSVVAYVGARASSARPSIAPHPQCNGYVFSVDIFEFCTLATQLCRTLAHHRRGPKTTTSTAQATLCCCRTPPPRALYSPSRAPWRRRWWEKASE